MLKLQIFADLDQIGWTWYIGGGGYWADLWNEENLTEQSITVGKSCLQQY